MVDSGSILITVLVLKDGSGVITGNVCILEPIPTYEGRGQTTDQ